MLFLVGLCVGAWAAWLLMRSMRRKTQRMLDEARLHVAGTLADEYRDARAAEWTV